MTSTIGIEIIDFGDDFICGKMPVDKRTLQPFGLLHGGASVALAETLGSVGGGIQINHETHNVVGLEINTSHLRSVSEGWVYGKANAIKVGKKIQVWGISIKNQQEKIISISRLTLAVVKNNK